MRKDSGLRLTTIKLDKDHRLSVFANWPYPKEKETLSLESS